jgi:signal transduction histidine kinase
MDNLAKETVFRSIYAYFMIAFILCVASVLFISFYSYYRIYQLTTDQSIAAVHGAIQTEKQKLSHLVAAYAEWAPSFENIVLHKNQAWVKDNIVKDFQKYFSIPHIFIIEADAEPKIVYHSTSLFSQTSDLTQIFDIPFDRHQSQSYFASYKNQVYLIALAEIKPEAVSPKKNLSPLFLAAVIPFNHETLSLFSQTYLLDHLRYFPPNAPNIPQQRLALDHNGKNLGYLSWQPNKDLTNILFVLVPTAMVVLIGLTILGIIIGRQILYAALGYDKAIKQLHQLTKNLEKARIQAEASNITKTKFLASMSHEIRTPMNGLLGMINLLKETKLNQGQQDYIKTMEVSAHSLLKMMDSILEYSKLETGVINLNFVAFNIRELIEEVHTLLSPIAFQKDLLFEIHLNKNMPLLIKSDPVRIQQILLHLVTNALKFTKAGSVKIHVSLKNLTTLQPALYIEVIDTGIGIAKEFQESLFDTFFQVDIDGQKVHDGAGLGLSIVRNLLNMLHGKIGLESQLDQGSTFSVQIPIEVIQPENP